MMANTLTASHATAAPAPRTTLDLDRAREAIRLGVQHLAFRVHPDGLQARYAPGAADIASEVARAALAARDAHETLACDPPQVSARRAAALVARARLAEQLAGLRDGATAAPRMELRSAYLAALADLMIEAMEHDAVAALEDRGLA